MMSKVSLWMCLAPLGACFGLEGASSPEVAVVELSPRVEVPLDANVRVELSSAVPDAASAWTFSLSTDDGREVAFELAADGPTALTLRPSPTWPPAARVRLAVASGGVHRDGTRLNLDPSAATFETVRAETRRRFALEGPRPGTRAPINLRLIAVAIEGFERPPQELSLRASGIELRAPVLAMDHGGVALAEIPAELGALATDTTYAVGVADAPSRSIAEGIVATGSVADLRAPSLRVREVALGDRRVRLLVESDEPVVVSGRVVGPGGDARPLEASAVPLERQTLASSAALDEGARSSISVDAVDLAGNRAETIHFEVEMPARPRVELSELVPTPLHDWNDGDDGALDAWPGSGPATEADEWIELINRSDRALDLTTIDLRVRALDTTPVEHALAAAPEARFSRGGSWRAWGVGEALVLRPRGSMAQRGLNLQIVWGEEVLDQVRLGLDAGADHPGGAPPDLGHEAIARDGGGRWRWCAPTPGEPVSRDCLN